ncbi:MAG: aminoacyl-tRNA hydrolase [Actinobacteria bacterium]|jgi:PTH1 family peptidyl-tRNA hydrolase|uniref:peptidyl-tRNA hydrolase n=1 Tax=freshwater metagenome TaxID=449393 RepID=A0A6J7H6L8_9ZZZZ|nr:aminoacyl-tRNA hydrolase [Actinomycetota bacterium]
MTWLIAGLGNPGPKYAATRHNIGFDVVDGLAAQVGSKLARHKRAMALAAEGRFGPPGSGESVVLVEPLSFMNESGGPVKALMGFYGVDAAQLVVVHDELDLPLGSIRIKLGGGDNGHNGLRSIRSSLGTGDFFRVRVGIGRPAGRQDPADYVLSGFGSAERAELPLLTERAEQAVESLVLNGLERTQQSFND